MFVSSQTFIYPNPVCGNTCLSDRNGKTGACYEARQTRTKAAESLYSSSPFLLSID
ncbi:MAG: hypothetical protein ACJA2S_000748, partial [Cyclobacteriaceae bacterium]